MRFQTELLYLATSLVTLGSFALGLTAEDWMRRTRSAKRASDKSKQ